jgi:hypothetical protein
MPAGFFHFMGNAVFRFSSSQVFRLAVRGNDRDAALKT